MPSLIGTAIVLTADSLGPSNQQQRGAPDQDDGGQVYPTDGPRRRRQYVRALNRLPSSLFTGYSADRDLRWLPRVSSSGRQAATTIATASPSVVYA